MSPANIAYLSGFQALMYSRPIYLVVDSQTAMLIVPGLEEEHATHAIGIDRVVVYYEHPEKGKAGENGRAEGRTIASEMLSSLRGRVQGAYFIPSFKRYDVIASLVEEHRA